MVGDGRIYILLWELMAIPQSTNNQMIFPFPTSELELKKLLEWEAFGEIQRLSKSGRATLTLAASRDQADS